MDCVTVSNNTPSNKAYEVHNLEIIHSQDYMEKEVIKFFFTTGKGSALFRRIKAEYESLEKAGAKTPVIVFDYATVETEEKLYKLQTVTVYESLDDDTDTYHIILECFEEDCKERNKIYGSSNVPSRGKGNAGI